MVGWKNTKQGWQAVADLGTNTFQLLIGKVVSGNLEIGLRKKIGVGLGKGGINQGLWTDDAYKRAVLALKEFARDLSDFGLQPKDCQAIGTSAFRSLQDLPNRLKPLQKETGFLVKVIDGETEARLIFEGIKASGVLASNEYSLVVDIGGGSVEWIFCKGETASWKMSLEIGGIRLREKFHHHEPILPQEVDAIRFFLQEQLATVISRIPADVIPVLVGCSGSFDSLIDMVFSDTPGFSAEQFPWFKLDVSDFNQLYYSILSRNLEERMALPGMIPLRAEMMVMAVILIKEIISVLEIRKIRTSSFSLKEGVFFCPQVLTE